MDLLKPRTDNSLQIFPQCISPHLKFCEESVNPWWCHVTPSGTLVNQNSPKDVCEGEGGRRDRSRGSIDENLSAWHVSHAVGPADHGVPSFRKLNQRMRSASLGFVFPELKTILRPGKLGENNAVPATALRRHLSLVPDTADVDDKLQTSGYKSLFTTSVSRPPRLKIYPGALTTESFRGTGQRYWQIEAKCDVKVHLYGLPIFECGVTWSDSADTSGLLEGVNRSWFLRIGTCADHRDHICARAVHGCRTLHHSPVRDCRKNEPITYSYGFLLNLDTKQFIVIDTAKRETFYKFENVNTSRDLWPLFGVFSRHRHHVQLKITSGTDLVVDRSVSALIFGHIQESRDRTPQKHFTSNIKYSIFNERI